MTHEEAIKRIQNIKQWFNLDDNEVKALNKAIANMEQCEVYDEPVEMELIHHDNEYITTKPVHGKFKGKFIASDKDGQLMHGWAYARPIKPKVLSFTEWLSQQMSGQYMSMRVKHIEFDFLYNEYNQYLNDNK